MVRPPPVIDCARVVAYANVKDIPYRKAGLLLIEGVPLEAVPHLAIAVNLGDDVGPLLFHCDQEWNCLGAAGAKTIEEAMTLAERNYPGVGSRWTQAETTTEEALAYYDAQPDARKCSFCGRRSFEVHRLVMGKGGVAICSVCTNEFHSLLQEGVDRGA
jgi:hypothetical protein